MGEKLFSYADKQVMEEVGSGGGSGSEALIVHAGGTPFAPTVDKTFDEIAEAANIGRSVTLIATNGDVMRLDTISEGTAAFTSSIAFNGKLIATTVAVDSNNTVTLNTVQLSE